ncbi:MAG: pentapeptide repeat-containing protein [Methanotrichaceae archaeon]
MIEIPANGIKASADSNAITYNHIKVIGDLELDRPEYNSIKIINSIIEGNISASNASFNGDVYFTNTSFRKNATFFNSEFKGNVDFSESQFYGDANFSQSRFLKGATFDYNTFDKKADFSASEFEKFGSFYDSTFGGNAVFILTLFNGAYANFESAKFVESAEFANSQFNTFFSCINAKYLKDANFRGVEFASGSNFNNVTFLGPARFDKSQFIQDSRFRNIFFNSTVDFTSARFDGPSFFNNAHFRRNAILDSVQFMGPSDLSGAQFDKDLCMNSTKISTMVLDNATFNSGSHLFLAKADINRFMVKWDMIKHLLSYDSSAYLSLVKNYKDLGLSEADDCYYQYRQLSQDLKSWSWSKVYDVLADITCGYGVRPDRPIICSLFLVILCSSILFWRNGLRIPSNMDKKTSFYDSLYYCLAIFFTIPLPDLKPSGKYRYIPVFLRALSWTLFALLIGTIGKVMIK